MSSTPFHSSTASLVSKQASPKNYEAAFGSLASSFGFGGVAPTTVPRRVAQTPQPKNSPTASVAPSSSQSAQKNYEAAFGSLSSRYGFGSGAVVSVPTLPQSKA